MAYPRSKKISANSHRFGTRRVTRAAKRIKGPPITGESHTEEIEKTVGSTGGSAPTVELGEDFSEKYGQWDTGSTPLRKTQVVVALDIGSAASRAMAFSKTGEVLAQSQSEYGEQLGLGVGGMGELIAPPAGLARGAQQPVESGHRGEIATRIQQHGEHGTALMARLQVVQSQAGERGVSTHPRKPKLP